GVFYYDYDGYQDYDTINISQVIRNKDASVRGGELEISSSPLDGLLVSLGVSALDATVKDVALPSGRIADREMPQAPSLSVTGLLRKEWQVARGYLAIQGDFKYAGERYFRSINHPAYREGAYTVGNARVSFGPASRRWEIAAFAKNVTDTTYRVFGYEDLGVNGVINDNYGPPRWMGIVGSLKW
ncbi:MAG: TonB-dependent receptor, partial [Gammaproteobacteria bacterium]